MADSSSTPDPLVGSRVGEYLITGVLGAGSMGIVYAAEHVTLGHRTACKVLRPEAMGQKDAVERFLAEARQVSQIRHNNLIDIFDIGELPDGRLYYVMEYLAGRPLTRVIAQGRLSFAEIVNVGRQVAAGLSAAHAVGLVHRDLSPDNLFLCEYPGALPLIKIMNFGVAKVVSGEVSPLPVTRRGALLGTPPYMAPEQITEAPVDARTDVYALGAVLFELCAGHPPFGKSPLSEVLSGHLRSPVPALTPAARKAGIPAAMQGVLTKALAKLPAERYPSAMALAEDLERLLRSTAVAGVGVAAGSRWRLLGLVAALLVLMLVGGYALRRSRRNSPAPETDLVVLRALALKILQAGLVDGDAAVRRQAVMALGQSHDARHKDLLVPHLGDVAVPVQVATARALGEIGNREAIAALQTRLAGPADPELLAAGGETLLRLEEPGGRAALVRAQQTAGPEAQLAATLALAEFGDRDAALALETQLRAAPPSGAGIADATLQILTRKAQHGDKAAQARLQGVLATVAAPLAQRLQAAACLLGTGDERARTLLSEAVAAEGPLQVMAAQLLCAADDVSGQPILRRVLTATEHALPERVEAAQGLGSCGDKDDARALGQRLGRGEPSAVLRQAEAGALLRLCNGDPVVLAEQSTGWVQVALEDGSPRTRAAGAATLGDLDAARAMPLIRKAMHDPSVEVRKAAATALGRSEDRAALDPLAAALADDNRDVRLQVWRSLVLVVQTLRGDGTGELNLSQALTDLLRQRAGQSSGGEQVAAASALLAAGDSSQRSQVQKGLTSGDAETQSIALTAAKTDPVLRTSALAQVLNDPAQSAELRQRAAAELLRLGDKRGLALLQAAVQQGGIAALTATLALQAMGESAGTGPGPLEQLRTLLQSADTALRRAAVALIAEFPLEQAVPLLLEESRDADRDVRAQVAQTAAELRSRRPNHSAGAPVLRALLEDEDAGVRAQAGALLAKQQRRNKRAEAAAPGNPEKSDSRRVSAQSGSPPDLLPQQPVVDAGIAAASSPPVAPPPAVPPSEPIPNKSRRGYLQIAAPPELEFQLDRQPAQTTSGKPIAVTAGEHHLAYFGGQQELTVAEGQTVTVNLTLSAVAQLVQSGLAAFDRRDFRRAKKPLEKASTLCARHREERATCNLVAFELTYNLARIYDAQDAWAEAMTEYEKILAPGFAGKVKTPERAAVTAAVARLTPRLGRLRVSKLVAGRCQTVSLWMPPGRHRVNVGNGQYVQVRAKETVEVKGCP